MGRNDLLKGSEGLIDAELDLLVKSPLGVFMKALGLRNGKGNPHKNNNPGRMKMRTGLWG